MTNSTRAFQVAIIPSHASYDAGDDGWAQQKAALFQQLRSVEGVESLDRVEHAVEGAKGGTADVFLTLASTGVLTAGLAAVASTIKSWINRDKARGVKLRVGADSFDVALIDEATLVKIAGMLVKK